MGRELNHTQKLIDNAMWCIAAINFHIAGTSFPTNATEDRLKLLELSVEDLTATASINLGRAMDSAYTLEKKTVEWIQDHWIEEWEKRIDYTHN